MADFLSNIFNPILQNASPMDTEVAKAAREKAKQDAAMQAVIDEAEDRKNNPDDYALAEEPSAAPTSLVPQSQIAEMAKFKRSPFEEAAQDRIPASQNNELKPQIPDIQQLAQEQKPKSKVDQYSDLLNTFKSLKPMQEQYQQSLGGLAIQQGANQIAQGLARGYGTDIGAGEAGIKALQQQAAQPLEALQQQMQVGKANLGLETEMQMSDPKSDVSNYYRQQAYTLLKKMNPNKDYTGQLENMSASQLKDLPGIKSSISSDKPNTRYVTIQENDGTIRSKLVDMNTGETIKDLGLAGYAYGSNIDPVTKELIRVSKSDPTLTPTKIGATSDVSAQSDKSKQAPVKEMDLGDLRSKRLISPSDFEIIEKTKDDFQKETSNIQKIIDGLSGVDSLVNESLKNPNAYSSIGGIVGGLFEPGKLTDEDAKRYVQSSGIASRIRDLESKYVKGTMSPGLAKEIQSTAKAYREALDAIARKKAEKMIKSSIKGFVGSGKNEINPEQIANYIYEKKYSEQKDEKSPSNEEKRILKDGRSAIFDRETKKFIRWEE